MLRSQHLVPKKRDWTVTQGYPLQNNCFITEGTHPHVHYIRMLGLQQHVDFPQGGDRKAFFLLLHLELLQCYNLT